MNQHFDGQLEVSILSIVPKLVTIAKIDSKTK